MPTTTAPLETYTKDHVRGWFADFRVTVSKNPRRGDDYYTETRKVEIVTTDFKNAYVYFWCTFDGVGTWPGTDSDEWIEYIPEPPMLPDYYPTRTT